ncbi:MAG: pirin family protein [Thermoleophilia bacterium]|nr:pirin family protein [Thermoleophilia bacterium]
MRKVLGIHEGSGTHWVGDGFPVRTVFTPGSTGGRLSPFLMLDHASATRFGPAEHPRGVGVHPHRGFETVTIVYEGELEHRDSTGAGGRIGPGDVQWMTAASGILHEEFHSEAFTRDGGTLEMAQLWVNLRSADKNAAPGYQTILESDIPSVDLPDGAGRVRVIAGTLAEREGPARTFTPMDVWDVRLAGGRPAALPLRPGWTAGLVVLRGAVSVDGGEPVTAGRMVLLDGDGGDVAVEAAGDAVLLVLSGEAIDEPVVARGPFVMTSEDEIRQAYEDFRAGRFGAIAV